MRSIMVERSSYGRERESSHFTSTNSNHSSFSSSLLDSIYRSIDRGEEDMAIDREGARNKSYGEAGANMRRGVMFKRDDDVADFHMIEKWMEKKASEKSAGRRKSVADLEVRKTRKDRGNSTWSSSDSSCGGAISSSEAEWFPVQRPRSIRTAFEKAEISGNRRDYEQKPKIETGFSKTKLRALKIYSDLKKVKQPISPGGKLAGFLNSLFVGGNMKKNKISDDSPSLKSMCSSASSVSRSCLSKTLSSRGKTTAGEKRSVRFSPVSVIVDDEFRPCDHKPKISEINNFNKIKQTSNSDAAKNHNNINTIRNVINEELMAQVMEKNRRVEEVARDLLRNYHRKKNQIDYEHENELPFDHPRKPNVKNEVYNDDEDEVYNDDEDDAASCASSDLFELDNLSAIGMERYKEELPVYESTRLGSTANGLIF